MNLSQLKGDLQGGMTSSILNIFQCIPYGLIAFAPLGSEYENSGIIACIIGAILAGFFASLFGGSPAQITSPGATECLIFSYIFIYLKDLNLFNSTSIQYLPTLLTLTFFAVILTGVFQFLLGLFKADYFIKFISYPVNAGIATGAGILIMIGATWKLLGISSWHSFGEVKFGSLFIGAVTAILLKNKKLIPGGFLGLPLIVVIGTGLYHLLLFIGLDKSTLGDTFKKFTFTLSHHYSPLSLLNDPNFFSYVQLLAPLALNLAIFCSLQSLLSVLNLKNISEKETNSRQELIGQGIGNMVSGSFGGLPSCGKFGRSILNYQEGGRTKLSGMLCALMTLVLAYLLSGFIDYLPKAVMFGLTFILGYKAIDKWTLELFSQILKGKVIISKELILNVAIILIVMILIFMGNFLTAISVGVLISILAFLGKMRGTLIKRVYESQSIPTKKIDDATMMKTLSQHLQNIKVIELGGMIYFGSAEKLSEEIEKLSKSGVTYIILDMKKVEDIDLTGARVLEKSYQTLKKEGKFLGFSHLKKESPVWQFFENIQLAKTIDPSHIFIDTDQALEYFEDRVLEINKQKREESEMNLADFPIFQSLTNDELQFLNGYLTLKTYQKEEIIFKEGDSGDAIFLIAKGAVDILIAIKSDESPLKRVQHLSSGSFFGEMALLQKGPRTATVIASSDLICYLLTKEKFQELTQANADLLVKIFTNLSKILSNRLLFINQLISEMER